MFARVVDRSCAGASHNGGISLRYTTGIKLDPCAYGMNLLYLEVTGLV